MSTFESTDTGNASDRTFLIVGAHENMTDALIIAHADGTQNRITLFSLPRDLYYKGKKINSIYADFGPHVFLKELSEITGLAISHYIIIDMFAFIDAVNILGGIDVTLEEPLIDPSYKIKEDGTWGTLYFREGTHHLNGIQALRVARSRNYSSDFSRAKRQQLILKGVKKRFEELGLQDLQKLFGLFRVLVKYVSTNLNPIELVSFFLQYKNTQIHAENVIDTSNVLYATYSNIYYLGEEVEITEDFNKGAYILLPVDNNWNIIRWYIRKLITGGKI